MKRYMIMTVLLAVLMLSAACAENSESQENQAPDSDTTNQEQAGKRMDGGPNEAGRPDDGRGDHDGQGGGIPSQSSEPDEELQVILDEEQAKHECFVLIPILTENIVDDNFNTSSQIDVAINLIYNLCDTYSIDTDRLYTTGQSMGGMTSFHLNVAYPNLFADSLFVGSQRNNGILDVLEEDKFFYIVSAGDDKASTGQTGLMVVFDADGVSYTHEEWSAQEDRDTQSASIEDMIAEGLNANFVTFTKGTTVAGGASGSEHLTSFDYAYKLSAVWDWLFAQSK